MQSKMVTIRKKHTQLENYENIWMFFLALFISLCPTDWVYMFVYVHAARVVS